MLQPWCLRPSANLPWKRVASTIKPMITFLRDATTLFSVSTTSGGFGRQYLFLQDPWVWDLWQSTTLLPGQDISIHTWFTLNPGNDYIEISGVMEIDTTLQRKIWDCSSHLKMF